LRDIILQQNAVIGPLVAGYCSAAKCSPMGPRAAEMLYNLEDIKLCNV